MNVADCYAVLGLPSHADDSEIRSAYRRQALVYHPDKCAAGASEEDVRLAAKRFQTLQLAKTVLLDPELRRLYSTPRPTRPVDVAWRISETVRWSEFDCCDEAAGTFTLACRCGGEYTLLDGPPSAPTRVECECCSLIILVLPDNPYDATAATDHSRRVFLLSYFCLFLCAHHHYGSDKRGTDGG